MPDMTPEEIVRAAESQLEPWDLATACQDVYRMIQIGLDPLEVEVVTHIARERQLRPLAVLRRAIRTLDLIERGEATLAMRASLATGCGGG